MKPPHKPPASDSLTTTASLFVEQYHAGGPRYRHHRHGRVRRAASRLISFFVRRLSRGQK